MDLRWLTERCCCVTSTAAMCLGLLPVRGWLTAPRPWPAPAAYGLGITLLALLEPPNFKTSPAYIRDLDPSSPLFPFLVDCFLAFVRTTVVFSLCSNRAALTNLQRCLLHYQHVHPLTPRGYRAVLYLHLFVAIFLADVYALFDTGRGGRKPWGVIQVAGMVTGVQWGMSFCMALLPKVRLGALAGDLRDECARLIAGAGDRPSSSTSSLCEQWRSLRLRQQYLHDMSYATTRVYQWLLAAILLTSTLYANLQIADCLLKITGAKKDIIPPEGQLLRKLAQISNFIMHSLCIVVLFVVYRSEGNENEQMCHMLQGHHAVLSSHATQEEPGCVREVTLFINQIRFQEPTDIIFGLLDLNLSSMMRV
ncbi:Cellulose synthase-like protein B1, partial [Frankliniella fusca]